MLQKSGAEQLKIDMKLQCKHRRHIMKWYPGSSEWPRLGGFYISNLFGVVVVTSICVFSKGHKLNQLDNETYHPNKGHIVYNNETRSIQFYCRYKFIIINNHTVDGRNPKQPPGMHKALQILPRSLTWTLKISPWKRRFRTWKPSFSGSMLNFGGVIISSHIFMRYVGLLDFSASSPVHPFRHGIPDDRPLEEGDFLNVDVTVGRWNGRGWWVPWCRDAGRPTLFKRQ